MAKYSRYDPRNKKRDRNKINSVLKDSRLRYEKPNEKTVVRSYIAEKVDAPRETQ